MTKKTDVKQKSVHFMLGGKGGIGKSAIALALGEYLADIHNSPSSVKYFDLDYSAYTLARYRSLNVERYDIRDFDNGENDGTVPIEVMFNQIFTDSVLTDSETTEFIFDPGSTGLVDLLDYLRTGKALSILRDAGIKTYVHTFLSPSDYSATRSSAIRIIDMLQRNVEILKGRGGVTREITTGADQIYLWIPQYQAPFAIKLENETWFKQASKHLSGVIYMPTQSDAETFEVNEIMEDHRTLSEVAADKKTDHFNKQYLNDLLDKNYNAISLVLR